MSIKNLMEERARVWDSMTALREKVAGESREFTGEERSSWDKAEARLNELTGDIEREQRADEFAKTLAPKFEKAADEIRADEVKPEYREVFEKWARFGSGELSSDEKRSLRDGFVESRALGVGTGAAGGYAVPQGFRDVLIETMRYYNAVRQVATVITTDNGATLPWPVNNDTANVGAILAENSQITQQDVALTQEQLSAYMYTSKLVLVSLQLLQDSAIDVESFLARKLGQRIGRIQNQHFTTGTGTAQPLGLVTGGTVGYTAPTGNTTSVTYAGLVALQYSIDPAYRNGGNVQWMLSDTALTGIRQLTDSQNRPLWEPSVQAGQPDMLLGKGIVINNDMPVPAANASPVAFGDFQAGYIIRDVSGVQTVRLDERYADFLQVGWFAYARTDATVQDTAAFRLYKNSAT